MLPPPPAEGLDGAKKGTVQNLVGEFRIKMVWHKHFFAMTIWYLPFPCAHSIAVWLSHQTTTVRDYRPHCPALFAE